MMTSVTLPSTSGPLHGGYSSVAEETTSSEPEFETPRPVKRCLVTPLTDSCKKRRKQSTPVRISAAESDLHTEGKPSSTSPEPELQCPVCQLYFNNSEQLQSHLVSDHSAVECKKEPEDFALNPQVERGETPLELTSNRPEVPWINELQSKEWMNPNLHGLPFNPTNPMFMTLPQFAQPDNMPRQPIRIFNPDAYCDLCNKEFCNKYFLKTHKANKHGIYSDPPSSEPLVNNVNIASYAGTIKLPTTVPSVEISTVKNEKSANIINPFNNLFPNPFSNKSFPQKTTKSNLPHLYESESNENVPNSNGFSSNSESDKISPDDQPAEESSSPNVQTESTSFKNESEGGIYYIPQSKMSPGNDIEISSRLRRIGVMNPKAFCEICCKEYCNKYFLRTHKMKRHGIYIPDDKEKDTKHEGGSNFPWQNNMQTSPLNLIMTEQSNIDRKTTSPSDISCDICGIKFQNASLSQLHNVSVHSKIYPKEEEHQDQTNEETKKENHPSNEKSINAEAISEDLQKLQTMILQLNELDVSKVCTTCNACNKEFENRYFLHAHMMTEHGILLDDVADVDKPVESENSSNNNTMCDLCGKDVQNVEEMKKHLLEFHPSNQGNLDNIKDEFNGFSTPEKSVNRIPVSSAERRISMNVTPTSSYCDICNKELCNKYFMKTHMQRMHGIEIENGAQIGGVICDICNKELCSKYFLRVHKHNTHGIVEYGTSLLQPRKNEGENATPQVPPDPDPALKPADLADLSHRYFTHFTEVCSICSRRFRSTKWLKAHLLSDHGQAGAEKWSELEQQLQQSIGQHSKAGVKCERGSPTLKIPNGGQERKEVGIQNVLSSLFGVDESSTKSYQCSFCPFTTPLLPLLFVHERSHSMSSDGAPLKCPVCTQSFLQPELLQHHMFAQHPFLPLPPFFNGNENPGETSKEPSEHAEDDDGGAKNKKKGKGKRAELSPEIGQNLRDAAKRAQVPAAYALPQGGEDAGYVMQAFLVEEAAAERRVVPAVVFLPVFQKQPAPLTVTFTLTPA
ncbi:unnamed protein product [Tenebrio molitor]|jgi:transcription elongation factor Elf1|nr:unnamed protein product [Tenebrio molitor]